MSLPIFFFYSWKLTRTVSFPLEYSAVMLPCIFSLSCFAMDKPSPVPPLASFTVKNLSNSLAVSTGSSSFALFSNTAAPSSVSVTFKSPSEYLAAFERILSKLCAVRFCQAPVLSAARVSQSSAQYRFPSACRRIRQGSALKYLRG